MANEQSNSGGSIGLPVGTKIGKYEIRERIGSGGQALVYKGYDAFLDRFVAIKQISSHLADNADFMTRFRREAQRLAKLGAEVISIHELIEDERGLFIVMEYVEGHTLETIIRDTNGPIETKAVLQVLWRLAATLHEVHSADIIHRDLKPANIIIAEGLRPKIFDFGVAASKTGQTSMVLGTTKYMAPELFEGGDVDGRADMYSLGFIAYEMLLGRPKFNEIFADIVRDKHSEALRWMKWHGNSSVAAPELHEVNPDIPKPLSKIVARMMAKNRDDRFANMEELGMAIKRNFSARAKTAAGGHRHYRPAREEDEALVAGPRGAPGDEADQLEVMDEGPATAPIPKRSLSTRTRLILIGVIVLSVLGIGLAIGLSIYSERQKYGATAEDYAKAKKVYDGRDYVEAGKWFERVMDKFAGTDQAALAEVMVHMSAARQAVKDKKWADAQREQNEADRLVTQAQKTRKNVLAETERIQDEIKAFDRDRINAHKYDEVMTAARELFEKNDFEAARKTLRDGLRGVETKPWEKEISEFRDDISRSEIRFMYNQYIADGEKLTGENKYEQARSQYELALSILESQEARAVLTADEIDELRKAARAALDKLGTEKGYAQAMKEAEDAREAGDLKGELKAVEDACRIQPSGELADRIKILKSRIAFREGQEALKAGNRDLARAKFEESLKYMKNTEAQNELENLDKESNREKLISEGDVLFTAGRLREAMDKYIEASKFGEDDPLNTKIIDCRYGLKRAEADALRDAKKYDEAIKAYEEAREIDPARNSEIDARLDAMQQQRDYESLLAAGDAALKDGQWKKAIDNYNKAKAIFDNEEVKERINRVRYEENLARGLDSFNKENYSDAIAYFKLARKYLNTPEINEWIRQAEEKLKAAK